MSENSVPSRSALPSDVSSRSAKKRARVWEYIETEVVDGKENSSCKYCKTKLSTEPGQGTNHLNRHIGMYCHTIPSEDRDRFLVTWKRQSAEREQPIFDPQECRVLIYFTEYRGTHTQLSELDTYLEDPSVYANPEENFDVLGWRKRNAEVYPALSLMARDFLAIPVRTVSFESAFSAAGRLLGKDRTSLSPESLEALMCAKDWIIGFSNEDEVQGMEGCRTCDLEQYT